MGADGYEIFDDDVASDVRATFEGVLEDGSSIEEATAAVLDEQGEAIDDMDDGPIIWLALAALHLERDALRPELRNRAIAIIDAGADIERWLPQHVEGRKQALARFRERLILSR